MRSRSARPTSIAIDRTRISGSSCWPCTRKNSRRSTTCCGRIPMFRLRNLRALAALLVALSAMPLLAEDDDNRFELKFAKDLAFRSGRVSIDHSFGSLAIRTHPGNEVQVRATIRSSDDEIGKQIRIITSEGAGGVSIRTDYPEIRRHRGHLSYSVDMTVALPANAPVTAKNSFGNTDVRGLRANSVIENKQGSIRF